MASKKAKAVLKTTKKNADATVYSQPCENALDPAYFVKVQMKDGNFHMAKLIDCKLSEKYDPKKPLTDFSYDYYIHYVDFDRRMDEWVPRTKIELTRNLVMEEEMQKKKKKHEEEIIDSEIENEHAGMTENDIANHEKATKLKTIDQIRMGNYTCSTWYYSPYPKGFDKIDTLYICEFCLTFFVTMNELERHNKHCLLTHPPGDEIYRHENNSMFEVDGARNPIYCENLCYIAKLFLDHKNLLFDTTPFLYYVLTENDEHGAHIVGYFSKDKESDKNYNLSCILALPFFQRRGYGKFLITFSYELSLIEQKPGTPEKPLSDLGRTSYTNWWTQRIIEYIREREDEDITIAEMSKDTCMRDRDILYTMRKKGIIKFVGGDYYICTDSKFLDQLYKEAGRPGLTVVREKIHWTPFKFRWNTEDVNV